MRGNQSLRKPTIARDAPGARPHPAAPKHHNQDRQIDAVPSNPEVWTPALTGEVLLHQQVVWFGGVPFGPWKQGQTPDGPETLQFISLNGLIGKTLTQVHKERVTGGSRG